MKYREFVYGLILYNMKWSKYMKKKELTKEYNLTLEKLADQFEDAMKFYPKKHGEIERFRRIMKFLLQNTKKWKEKKGILFLCIGTDRSTGDSLGPLFGYKMKHFEGTDIKVMGTLDDPVHANNLDFYTRIISEMYQDWFVIAVDASLGDEKDVGTVYIHMGSIKPGAGVGKDLVQVGDISITGVVASEDLANCLNVIRLSLVMKLADFIYDGISGINSICKKRTKVFLKDTA